MGDNRQKISSCSKEVSNNPNYDQGKLEELLCGIISKTSGSGTLFRVEVLDYTESDKPGESTKVEVGRDMARSSVTVQTQLAGHSEKWMAHIFLKKDFQKKALAFSNEIKKAAQSICEENNQKHASPDGGQGIPAPLPIPKPEGLGTSGDDGAAAPQPKKQRKKRIMAAAVVTDKVMLEILERCLRATGGVPRIDQREFWDIIAPLGIATSRISVLAILRKKGVVNVLMPVKRKPIVEITQFGIDMLEAHKQQLESEKLGSEEKKRLQKALAFPGKFLSLLKECQDLLSAYAELEKLKVAEVDIPRQITALQEDLANIEPAKKKCLEKIEVLISQINLGKVAELVEIAEKAVEKK